METVGRGEGAKLRLRHGGPTHTGMKTTLGHTSGRPGPTAGAVLQPGPLRGQVRECLEGGAAGMRVLAAGSQGNPTQRRVHGRDGQVSVLF